MDDDVIRILVATDNHLGFLEKDAIRGNDSFAAFEEIFLTAKTKSADFVLLAGDLFHENKPSRRTLHASFDILRKHCLGESPVFIEMLNEQSEIFKTRQGRVNYEDPYHAISLPVFAIHGNHDDPSREGGHREALAALDLLAVSNLINYFGKTAQVDDIEITPVLIRKQSTTVAIYGLGAIRDERLNRMWNQKKVKFVRPAAEQGRDEYFNIFILHQNRDYGRGQKNCVHESMIPEWMDLVIWGNEHECQPRLNESLVGTFRIFQPGSSIACSLVEGESSAFPKHMGLLEIKSRHFRLLPQRFTQIRPFKYSDMVLRDCHGLEPHDPQIEDQLKQILTARVNEMIEEARLESESVSNGWPEQLDYRIESPHLVLVRLRVEHTGFPSLNQQRFGTQFLNVVANPPSILQFTKKRKEGITGGRIETTGRSAIEMLQEEGEAEEVLSKISIEDLVKESLESGNKRLGLLAETDLARALEDFVIRKHISAISDTVEESLERTQGALCKDNTILAADRSSIADAAARVKDTTEKNTRRESRMFEAKSTRQSNKNIEEVDDEVDLRHAMRTNSDDDEGVQRQDDDKDSDEDEDDIPKKKAPPGKGRKAAGGGAVSSKSSVAVSKTTGKTASRSKFQQSSAKGTMSQKSLFDYSARISDSSAMKASIKAPGPAAAGKKTTTSTSNRMTSRLVEEEVEDFDDDNNNNSDEDGFGLSKPKSVTGGAVRGKTTRTTTTTQMKTVGKVSPMAVLTTSTSRRGTTSRSAALKKTNYKEPSDDEALDVDVDDEDGDIKDNDENGGDSEEESYRPKKYELEDENEVIELEDSEVEEVVQPKRGFPKKVNENTNNKSSISNYNNKKVTPASNPSTKLPKKSQRALVLDDDDNDDLSDDYNKGGAKTSNNAGRASKLLQSVSDNSSNTTSTTIAATGGGKKRQLPLSFSQQQTGGASQRKRNKPTANNGLNIDAWD